MALGLDRMLGEGTLVELFPAWNGERFPLHVYHPSRHLPPAKMRVFLDFIRGDVAAPSTAWTARAPIGLDQTATERDPSRSGTGAKQPP
jgi:hypothetical protein